MTVTREQLFKEVWAEPMTAVAQRYDVSANFLARICEHMTVPVPPRGYWQQLAVGKKVDVPALPSVQLGSAVEWTPGQMPTMSSALPVAPMPTESLSVSQPAKRRSVCSRPTSATPEYPECLRTDSATLNSSATVKLPPYFN